MSSDSAIVASGNASYNAVGGTGGQVQEKQKHGKVIEFPIAIAF